MSPPIPAPVAPPPPVRPAGPIEPPPPAAGASGPSGKVVGGLVAGGVGVVAIAFGAGFGVDAIARWHDSQGACSGLKCPTAGAQAYSGEAGRAADASTAFFVVGAAGVAAAAVLLLWPSHSDSSRAGIDVAPMLGGVGGVYGLTVGGRL